MTEIFLSAGETSGDLYGALLARNLCDQESSMKLFGLGSEEMAGAGVELIDDMARHSVMGLVEVLAHLPDFKKLFKQVEAEIARRRPAAAVLIDFPDFHFRLLPILAKYNVPVYYYISPQLWAWRQGRVKVLQKYVKKIMVIFPFEVDFYQGHKVSAEFVGHPLLDLLEEAPQENSHDIFTRHGLDSERPILGLMPGSRKMEIRRHLPIMLETWRCFKKENPEFQAAIPVANDEVKELLGEYIDSTEADLLMIPREAYQVRESFAAVITASGTATVENLMLGNPMIVIYRMHPLSFALARRLVKVPYMAMVNLLAGREIVPELVQGEVTVEKLNQTLIDLLEPKYLARQKQELAEVKASLGGPGASKRAAEIVLAGMMV